MHAIKWVSIIFCICLVSSLALAEPFVNEEAQKILTSDSLLIEHKITTQTAIQGNLNWFEVIHGFYPKETYRQIILTEDHSVPYKNKNDSSVIFRVNSPTENTVVQSTYLIQTKNEYKPISSGVSFPISSIPDDVQPYLQETEFIDITPEIKTTASLIASGKDDLFQVSQDVASWVTGNIEYDLSTLTEDAVQKASWVIKNRQGVCDELSILYIAMMRSLGIPARFISGVSYTNSPLFDDPWNPHAWTEVYFPGHGWVPFDLTYQQFGYIDASHITFSESVDAGKIITEYLWEGYNLKDTKVDLTQTDFKQDILEYGNPISEPFTMQVAPLYKNVDLQSYNVLEITIENTNDHYISSTLYINAPVEIDLDSRRIPIYAKPNEKKTYYLLLSLSGLSSGFLYTFPVSVHTSSGSFEKTEFKASEKSSKVTLDTVNSYLQENVVDSSKTAFSIQCSAEKEIVLIDENTDIICRLTNNGNIYLTNGNVCFDSECEDITLDIGGGLTKRFTVSERISGEYAYDITASFGELEERSAVKIFTQDVATIAIGAFSSGNIVVGQEFNASLFLNKTSESSPKNVDLRMIFNGKLLRWNLESLHSNTNITIPLHSYFLNDGINTVEIFISWEDLNGGQHFVEKTEVFDSNFTFIESIKAWWFKLFY